MEEVNLALNMQNHYNESIACTMRYLGSNDYELEAVAQWLNP
jgi:hypothetical protein